MKEYECLKARMKKIWMVNIDQTLDLIEYEQYLKDLKVGSYLIWTLWYYYPNFSCDEQLKEWQCHSVRPFVTEWLFYSLQAN